LAMGSPVQRCKFEHHRQLLASLCGDKAK